MTEAGTQGDPVNTDAGKRFYTCHEVISTSVCFGTFCVVINKSVNICTVLVTVQ